jgi:Tol biopolymer transport system component
MKRIAVVTIALLAACGGAPDAPAPQAAPSAVLPRAYPADPAEPHLANLRMLTDGGENAEAYFSADGKQLIFQSTRPDEYPCDQIYTLDIETAATQRVSTGEGRTTCAYFFPAGDRILYSSTHLVSPACPAPPDRSHGYVWGLYDYDIFTAERDGSNLRRLTDTPGYDAEATLSSDGRTIVFTSARDGDLDIYTMDAEGGNVRRLTDEPGYDGGPFFSPDGALIVYRAYHPTDSTELADFRALLADGLVRPGVLSVYVMNADGSGKRKVTDQAGANFAPFFHPNGRKILFSSNMDDASGRNFDIYMIDIDGSGLERITQHAEFDGFPMFSPDGSKLVFASNRGAARAGETNVFIADWVENPGGAASR